MLALALLALAPPVAQEPLPDEVALLEGRVLVEELDGERVPLEKGSLLVEFPDKPGRRSIEVRDGCFAEPHGSLDVVLEVVSVQVSGGRARVPGGRAELRFLEGPPTLVVYALPSYGAERLDELYLLEGEVLLDEGPGGPVPVPRGVLRLRLDGEEVTREVAVVDGRFELVESRRDRLYRAVAVELEDGRFGAFYEGSFPFHFEDGKARVLAQPVRATTVLPREARTGTPLLHARFEVQDPQRHFPEVARDPRKTRPIPPRGDLRLVPIDPRTTRYLVRAEGYAPVWIHVDPIAGSETTERVDLERSGKARLRRVGPRVSNSWDVLRVRDDDGEVLYEGPFEGHLVDLPARGNLMFRLEGRRRENPFVWGEGSGAVAPGGEAEVEVTSWKEPRITPVAFAGSLVLPPGWNLTGEALDIHQHEESWIRTGHALAPGELAWVEREDGSRAAPFRFEGLAPGGYRLRLGDLRAHLEVRPWGDESCRLVLPELARVTIAVVERGTGRALEAGAVHAGLAPVEGSGSYRIDVSSRDLGCGEFLLHLPAGQPVKVDVRPEAGRRAQVDRTYPAGDHREVIEVEPRMGVAFTVPGIPAGERDPVLSMTLESGPPGGELIWPRTARNAVEVTVPGEYLIRLHVSGHESEQVAVSIGRDELVRRELRLTPLDR